MYHWLIFTSILLGLTAAQDLTYSSFATCSYTGDPHLQPFPTSSGQITNLYFCPYIGWQILLQNKWVYIVVKVGPSPYVILDYVVFFYQANGDIACVLIGSSGYSTCPTSSPVVSIINTGGLSWNHWYPLAQYFDLQISSYAWGTSKRYDFIIRQTFNLISQSTGVCVKFNCSLEQIIIPPPIIIRICGIYIAAAQKQAIGPIVDTTVKLITMACQNDLILSFNLKFAQTAVVNLIHSSLAQINGQDYQNAVIKAQTNIQAAIIEANRQTAAIIGQEATCVELKVCLTNDEE